MTNCQNCGAECKTIIDLGDQVICNRFAASKEMLKKETKYPLRIVFCPSCYLVQQSVVLPTGLVFDENFNYLSGASKDAVKHFTALDEELIKELGTKPGEYIVAIGSNDGTELLPFKLAGINVIGVEPAPKPAKIANDNGLYTIVNEFENCTEEIDKRANGRIALITAFNVMAHTGSIHKFLENVAYILKKNPDAVFVNQGQYLPDIMEKVSFDTMYHEHNRFYTITSMQNLFSKHGMKIYDAKRTEYYGGSIIAYASVKEIPETERLKSIKESEEKYKRFETYKDFAERAQSSKSKLLALLEKAKSEGAVIVGAGAPMKSSVLLSYCGIDDRLLDALTELNHLKIGTYSPSGIKVYNELTYFKDHKIDYVLILSWNMKDTIISSLRNMGYNGKFIVPLPEPKVI
ncbi:MAG: methyltransferase domain-containing protein [Candidatus Micrarchaeota archaeon]|nr:methyltransferase domain-containing protein [Candidatus Micrarchaeota archaeon]